VVPGLAVVFITMAVSSVSAWDSKNWKNITHPTHSYLTEWAIDQLKGKYPELDKYRKIIIEGANTELHELRVKNDRMYDVNLDDKRQEHRGTNEGCDDIKGWWVDAREAYRIKDPEDKYRKQAYFLVGIMLHMIEDMGVPAHAHGIKHQASLDEMDHFELAGTLTRWVAPDPNDITKQDPQYDQPWEYYKFSKDWTREHVPNYPSRTYFPMSGWNKDQLRILKERRSQTAAVVKWTLESVARAFRL